MDDASLDGGSDLLFGMEAIAAHLSLTKRQALHLHEKGELPTFKMGRTVCARRSTLAKHFAAQERRSGRSGHSAHGEPSGHSTLNDA